MSVNFRDTKNVRIKPTPLPDDYKDWLGNLPRDKSWSMIVYGGSHSGKTSFLVEFGAILSKHGKVLYANFEEDMQTGTMQIKTRRMKIEKRCPWSNENLIFLCDGKPKTSEAITLLNNELETGKYQYCIVDSLQSVCKKISDNEAFVDFYKSNYPNVSFIFVLHGTKDEKTYKGSTYLKHMTDITIAMSKGVADCEPKNRFKDSKKYYSRNIFTRALL